MIKAEQIPVEVAKVASQWFDGFEIEEGIAALLNVWPGAEQTKLCGGRSGPALILPLSQERAADLNEGDDELLWRRD
jgi:hypothetical protein